MSIEDPPTFEVGQRWRDADGDVWRVDTVNPLGEAELVDVGDTKVRMDGARVHRMWGPLTPAGGTQ